MTVDRSLGQRTLRRYRIMFKAALAEIGIGLAIILAGIIVAINTSNTDWIGWGLLVVLVASVGAYKILNSTVRLLEVEAQDKGWDNLV